MMSRLKERSPVCAPERSFVSTGSRASIGPLLLLGSASGGRNCGDGVKQPAAEDGGEHVPINPSRHRTPGPAPVDGRGCRCGWREGRWSRGAFDEDDVGRCATGVGEGHAFVVLASGVASRMETALVCGEGMLRSLDLSCSSFYSLSCPAVDESVSSSA